MSDKKTIEINLLNSYFSVVAADEEYVREIADFVKDNLNEILKRNPFTNHIQIALLGCMNIAEMLFDSKKVIIEKEKELLDEVRKTESIEEKLEHFQTIIDQNKVTASEYEEKIATLEKTIKEKEELLDRYVNYLKQAKTESESNRESILNLQSQLFESQMKLNNNQTEEVTNITSEQEEEQLFLRI